MQEMKVLIPVFLSFITIASVELSTATEGWSCDPPDGAEADLNCDHLLPIFLPNALGSISPMFEDVLSPTCGDMKEQIYGDEEDIHVFFSLDEGITLKAQCPEETQVIIKFKLCFKEKRVQAVTLDCRSIIDKSRIKDRYNATNDAPYNLVKCRENSAIQKMYFMEHETPFVTRVIFGCMEYDVK